MRLPPEGQNGDGMYDYGGFTVFFDWARWGYGVYDGETELAAFDTETEARAYVTGWNGGG